MLDARKLPERAQDCNSLDELEAWMRANRTFEPIDGDRLLEIVRAELSKGAQNAKGSKCPPNALSME